MFSTVSFGSSLLGLFNFNGAIVDPLLKIIDFSFDSFTFLLKLLVLVKSFFVVLVFILSDPHVGFEFNVSLNLLDVVQVVSSSEDRNLFLLGEQDFPLLLIDHLELGNSLVVGDLELVLDSNSVRVDPLLNVCLGVDLSLFSV